MQKKSIKLLRKNKLNYLRKNELNYQELTKIDDDEWIKVNGSVLYYLLASYRMKRKKSELDKKSIEILCQHFYDLKVLHHFGVVEAHDEAFYHYISAKDAKIIFKPWEKEKEICGRHFVILKDIDNNIPFPPSKLPKLRKKYLELKKKEKKWEEHQKELKLIQFK